MSQHTPGPWKVDQVEPHVAVVIKRPDLYVTVDHRENLTNAGPDARLIAAAPEMLECLRHIFDLADESAKGIDGYEQIAEWSRNLLAKVEATLVRPATRDSGQEEHR